MAKVIAFGPHPDDIEILCAGTLTKYKANGHEVAMVCVTNGEVGSTELTKREIAVVREEEARKSAKIIGAEFFWLGYPDEFLFNTPESRLHIIEIIRQFSPDIIITTDKDHDYHPDHTTVGQLIWDTHVMGAVKNIETKTKAMKNIPEIFFMDTVAGIDFQPEFYVDITEFLEIREEMLRCHTSQLGFCDEMYGDNIVDNARLQAGFRGYQAGCKYAEAFRRPKFYPQKIDSTGLLPYVPESAEQLIHHHHSRTRLSDTDNVASLKNKGNKILSIK